MLILVVPQLVLHVDTCYSCELLWIQCMSHRVDCCFRFRQGIVSGVGRTIQTWAQRRVIRAVGFWAGETGLVLRSVGDRPIQGAIQTDASINPGSSTQIRCQWHPMASNGTQSAVQNCCHFVSHTGTAADLCSTPKGRLAVWWSSASYPTAAHKLIVRTCQDMSGLVECAEFGSCSHGSMFVQTDLWQRFHDSWKRCSVYLTDMPCESVEVIGMNTAVIAGASGATGFAIPEDTVSARVTSILKCGASAWEVLTLSNWIISSWSEDVFWFILVRKPASRKMLRFGYVKRLWQQHHVGKIEMWWP